MGRSTAQTRRAVPTTASSDRDLALEPGMRTRFDVVGELLEEGRTADAACAEVGRLLARDGADLGEALDGLRSTYADVVGGEPDFAAVRALCTAWGEQTLGHLHQMSCEDPMTGLATRGHLVVRLEEVYREAEERRAQVPRSHALVVVEDPVGTERAGGGSGDELVRALGLARLGNRIRSVFPGEETIAQVQAGRVVALARRDDLLGRRVSLLSELVARPAPHTGRVRVWVEGLPAGFAGGVRLVDELSRA